MLNCVSSARSTAWEFSEKVGNFRIDFPEEVGPFPHLSFPPCSSPTFSPSLSLYNPIQLGGLEECCKLLRRCLGQSPGRNRIWCISALKYDIWSNNFNDFPENQLTKLRAVQIVLRQFRKCYALLRSTGVRIGAQSDCAVLPCSAASVHNAVTGSDIFWILKHPQIKCKK